MGGGLLELVAHGVQDSYMIGNPQITFFKIVFKRHTNFSLESVQATFDGTADFGQRIVVTIPRNGDLVNTIVLEADLPAITTDSDAVGKEGTINYVNGLGHVLIEYVELEIGGQVIDKHYGEWMEIWTQLSYDESKQNAYDIIYMSDVILPVQKPSNFTFYKFDPTSKSKLAMVLDKNIHTEVLIALNSKDEMINVTKNISVLFLNY